MQVNLILIDDSEVDHLMVKNACRKSAIQGDYLYFQSPDKGLDMILNIDSEQLKKEKFVLLLDINMPELNGFHLLRQIRQHPELSLLPILMFSTSNNEKDMHKALSSGANAYLIKPSMVEDYKKMIHAIKTFWKFHGS
jgi:CheY-like chemotaxis protein